AFLGSLHVPIWAFQRLWWKELSVASWLRPEELLNDTFDTTAAPVFTPSPDFRCKRRLTSAAGEWTGKLG
ncbi:unnamed protein product, partial [Durusdinium trenchii]